MDDLDGVVREELGQAAVGAGSPSSSARRAPCSGEASSSPVTRTPILRSASMCTVPMKPLPITAAPMSLRRGMRWALLEWDAVALISTEPRWGRLAGARPVYTTR